MAEGGVVKATATARELLLELRRAYWLPPFAVREHTPERPREKNRGADLSTPAPALHSLSLSPLRVAHRPSLMSLPTAQADGVREVVDTMVAQYGESKLLQSLDGVDMKSPEDSVAPIVRMLTMLRNRDMLLCYLRHRLGRIEQARWDVAGTLPEEALELLSPNEREYDREYAALLSEFQTAYDLDLTRDTKPPTDLYIKVLAREEVGAFIGPESGATIDPVKAGDTIYLRRGDVEPLIRQGRLEHIE